MDDLTAPTGREAELRAIGEPPPRVLVLGATGYLGGRLVPRLLAAGYRVRVAVRDTARVNAFPWSASVEVREGAVEDVAAMEAACHDVDVVYYLVHGMSSGKDFGARDRAGAESVAEAAARGGVARIVYLGGLHPEGQKLSEHLRSRVEVGEIFLAGATPAVVLQAGVVIGSGSASFEMIRHLTDVLPYMPAPRWVRNRIQPIAVRDVLYYLLAMARVEEPLNRPFDIGGPDVLRYGQMMNGYAVAAGLPQRAIAPLPVLTPRLASHWVSLVTPVPRQIARPLIESLQNECIMSDHDIDAVVPPPAGGLTPYREAVSLAIARTDADLVETGWQDARVLGAPSDPLPGDPDWAGRVVDVDDRSRRSTAQPDAVWRVIESIGGENGWYSPPWLWRLRGLFDRAVGGVGLRRGRRSRSTVTVGDAVDWWRVESVEPGTLLRLRAEMRLPGLAWLELSVEPDGDGSIYRQRAIFFPKGLLGRLYWLALLPFHAIIFPGMARRITHTAENAA